MQVHCHSTGGRGEGAHPRGLWASLPGSLALGSVSGYIETLGPWSRDQFFCGASVCLVQSVATGSLTELPAERRPENPLPPIPTP